MTLRYVDEAVLSDATAPNRLIWLADVGAVVPAIGLVVLAVGPLRSEPA